MATGARGAALSAIANAPQPSAASGQGGVGAHYVETDAHQVGPFQSSGDAQTYAKNVAHAMAILRGMQSSPGKAPKTPEHVFDPSGQSAVPAGLQRVPAPDRGTAYLPSSQLKPIGK